MRCILIKRLFIEKEIRKERIQKITKSKDGRGQD